MTADQIAEALEAEASKLTNIAKLLRGEDTKKGQQ